MKKRVLLLAVLFVIASVCFVFASSRARSISPTLSFNGTQAVCSVTYNGDDMSDNISITMTLYQGATVVNSWSTSGTGSVYFSHRAYAPRGYQYTLTIDSVVNGVSQSPISVSKSN